MSTDIVLMFMMVLKCRAVTLLGFILEATNISVEYAGTPTPLTYFRVRNKALGPFLWEQRYPAPIRAYNKSRYQAVHSGSAPDTPCHCPGQVRDLF